MENAIRICLIEDDENLGEALVERLEMDGYACIWHRRGTDAKRDLQRHGYDIAISDIHLPDISGGELFESLLAAGVALPPFIFITGYGAIDDAVRLLKLGAEDYLTKPFEVAALMQKIKTISARNAMSEHRSGTLGISDEMRRIEQMLPRIAANSGTVLITGESGVGKEVVARALHRLTELKGPLPFVAANCGAITESLMEAELFGHERGAFTGASREKKGLFEQANDGTLFLDEIGDMPLPMQVKLLRVIQERVITRVGGERSIPVAIRLICATNRDLKELVKLGEFREDLYYRIHVVHINIPALRNRRDDIPWLAAQILDKLAAGGAPARKLHPLAERALLEHDWPGNVRELKNCLERACIFSSRTTLTISDLFGGVLADMDEHASPESLAEFVQACERRYIEQMLAASAWRIKDTAAQLGITRKNLWEKMRKYGIKSPGDEDAE
ncbi:MAG TPA: sigma-54 dependent transcriptional regulator [Rhodocyclaceae bacterium]|nr:sigma-54 dependent transcriptional regulator [Rhodocyclaceae bacterium]